MVNIIENATIPFNINDMEDLGSVDNNFYMVSYKNSEIKGINFITYILNSSKLCDIIDFEELTYNEKSQMMDILLNYSQDMVFIPKIINSLIDCLLTYKGIDVIDYSKSFLTKEEVLLFISDNKEYMDKLISFFDSLFVFMLTVSGMIVKHGNDNIEYDELISYYKDVNIIKEQQINPNVCSVLFSPMFYRYYEQPINENNVSFYDIEYTKKIYNGKTILSVILNNSNSIMYKMMTLLENNNK